jgi:hypothetical protein
MHPWLALFIACVFAETARAETPPFDEQKTHELMGRCWVPVEPDMNTSRLYRMEDTSDQAIDLKAEDPAEKTEGATLMLEGEERGRGNPLQDSSPLASSSLSTPGKYEGACRFVPDGRFGSGLKLSGPDSVVVSPLSLSRHSLAISGWFKPEKNQGTLILVPAKKKGPAPLECRLLADGAVSVLMAGEEQGRTGNTFAPGQWRHIAVNYTYTVQVPAGTRQWRTEPTGVQAYLNGKPFLWLRGGQYVGQLSPIVFFGNNETRTAPFLGVVDELHIAKEDRGYYLWDTSLVDAESKRKLVDDAPYFRSKADLSAYAAVDGTLDPSIGPLTPALVFRREPAEPKSPAFIDGIRSQGVVSGQGPGIAAWRFKDKVSAEEGSIEFWFSPHDWDNRIIFSVEKPVLTVAILRVACASAETGKSAPLIEIDVPLTTEVKKLKAGTYYPFNPGTWHHALVTWHGSSAALYVNGEPAEPEFFRLDFARPASQLPKDAVMAEIRFGATDSQKTLGPRLPLMPHSTVFDEFRFYRRRLSRSEAMNAYRRYLPDTPVKELPFAEIALDMNYPRKLVWTNVFVLARERDQVAAIRLKVSDEQGAVIADEPLPPLEDGTSAAQLKDRETGYGRYVAVYTFTDKGGQTLHTETVTLDRPRPPWLGCTLGIHEGQVLPGWSPMDYRDGRISCWGREITVDGRGWPADIVSQGKSILASPVRILLKAEQGDLDLKSSAAGPELLKDQDDIIVTRGKASAGDWGLQTTLTTEFDGLIKVEATLTGPPNAEIRQFVVEFPLRFAKDQLYGFWAGGRSFRGSCDYRKLPEGEGAVFRSNKTGRSHEQWQGSVSFLPYLTVCDDWRGFVWLAENDRNWSQSWETPAQEILRNSEVTTLRLNLIHQPKQVAKPLTYVFGIQPTPIRPLRKDWRSFTGKLDFGEVDGFNGCWLRSDDGTHFDFTLAPKGLDWSRVARRNRKGRKLLLYLDRAWQRAPEDALEYNHLWRGWGDATCYYPEVRDCYIYYMNEWIRRGFIYGGYIDDVWIKPTLVESSGLAYRRDDGKPEWGVEFFAFRDLLKRLRWLFHDNGMDPVIWVHATQTPYIPMLSFVDTMLEGEDRFLPPNHPSNFILQWGTDRIRYSNAVKWGVPSNWMNKVGMLKPGGTAHWYFRQRRAYQAALGLCDVRDTAGGDGHSASFASTGLYDDAAEFIGYWDSQNPIRPSTEKCLASVYKFPDRVAALLVNTSAREVVAEVTVDAASIRKHLGTDGFRFDDADTAKPPEDLGALAEAVGKDVVNQVMGAAEEATAAPEETDHLEEAMAQEKKQRLAKTTEGMFDEGRFRFEDNALRLKIRPYDYRLLVIRPENESASDK